MTTLDKMLQGLANALGASLSTLTTTAKTVVGAINELKSGLTTTNTTVSGHTSTIGSGALDTTSQTLIGAVNELYALGDHVQANSISTTDNIFNTGAKIYPVITPNKTGTAIVIVSCWAQYNTHTPGPLSGSISFAGGMADAYGNGQISPISANGVAILMGTVTKDVPIQFKFQSDGSTTSVKILAALIIA